MWMFGIGTLVLLFICGINRQIAPWPLITNGMTRQQVVSVANQQKMHHFDWGSNSEFVVIRQQLRTMIGITDYWMVIEFDSSDVVVNVTCRKIVRGI